MNDKGVALPVALIVMAVLVSLIVAFLALASTEPQIASNQKVGAQARRPRRRGSRGPVGADQGGHDSWFLGRSQPGQHQSVGSALQRRDLRPGERPLGQFSVTVADGAGANEKVVTAVGWVPSNTNPIAVKKIQVRAIRIKRIDPPCAICAGAESPRREPAPRSASAAPPRSTPRWRRGRATAPA